MFTTPYWRKSTFKIRQKRKKSIKEVLFVLGKISKIGKHGDNYKLIFKNPETKAETTEWFSNEDLADLRKTPKKERLKK